MASPPLTGPLRPEPPGPTDVREQSVLAVLVVPAGLGLVDRGVELLERDARAPRDVLDVDHPAIVPP